MVEDTFDDKTFQQDAQRTNFLDFVARGAVDKSAAVGCLLDKPFFDKFLNCLAYGNTANAQAFGKVTLDEARAQRKFAGADGIA
jgi:hypothetical protein